jgi:hypothetical protein
MDKHILIAGDISEGFTFYGPFDSAAEAIEAGDRNLDGAWVAAPITPISEPDLDGTSGQDRESYSHNQDRDSYLV